MKSCIVYFLFFFCILTSDIIYSQVKWVNPSPWPFLPKAIYFTDSLYGWAVGGREDIIKTTNGGLEWTGQTLPSVKVTDLPALLNNVYFTDRNNGWIIGGSESAVGGVIFRTTDGGETWICVNPKSDYALPSYNDMYIASPDTAFIAGFDGIIHTTDGGTTWDYSSSTGKTTSVYFIDPLNGFCTNSAGKVLRTADGGKSWAQIASMTDNNHIRIRFADSRTGWLISSESYSENALIYKTADGGHSWTMQFNLMNSIYYDLKVIDSLHASVCGSHGLILSTQDGGNSWYNEASNNPATYYSIAYAGSKRWAAGGEPHYPIPTLIYESRQSGLPWETRSSFFTGNDLTAIDFSSKAKGWIAGFNGDLFSTDDGGLCWKNNDLFSINFTSISAPDEKNIFLSGLNGEFVKSANGGVSWTVSNIPPLHGFCKIKFFSAWNGFIADGIGGFLRTTDGGNSWTETSLGYAHDFYFLDSLNGWIIRNPVCTGISEIYHTTDGGLTWKDTTSINSYINQVHFTNNQTGWMTAYSGELWKTTDGGKSWKLLNDIEVSYKFDSPLVFLNENEGYFAGSLDDPGLYRTTDGGQTFIKVGEIYDVNFLYPHCSGYLWGVGKYGQIMNYKLWATDVTDNEVLQQEARNFRLAQNYPNPFNPSTTIKYDIKNRGHVTLKIYNMLGKVAAIIVDKEQEPGSYSVKFNAQGMPSGIYLYVLEAGSMKAVNKMVLLK